MPPHPKDNAHRCQRASEEGEPARPYAAMIDGLDKEKDIRHDIEKLSDEKGRSNMA
jgi:hypothetical protein